MCIDCGNPLRAGEIPPERAGSSSPRAAAAPADLRVRRGAGPAEAGLFPTTVIGSLRGGLGQRYRARQEGRRDGGRPLLRVPSACRQAPSCRSEMHEKLNPAIDQAIAIQEQVGLDEITDGEWRRESYVRYTSSVPLAPRPPLSPAESCVKVFAENVAGFTPDLLDNAGTSYSGNGPGTTPR